MNNLKDTNLEFVDIGKQKTLALDADNVFWAVFSKKRRDKGADEKLLRLYRNVKKRLDEQMRDFRFGTELTAVYIDPTDRCNCDCPYCYIPVKTRKSGRSMIKKELFRALERIGEYFCQKNQKKKAVIIFHASEPLIVKDILFESIKKFGEQFKFGIQTNGMLIESDDVKFLKEYRVGMGISLDASLPSLNNRLRRTWGQGGNFKKAVEAIEMFDGYEGLNVISTITKFNVTALPQTVKFLHSKKVPCVLFNPMRFTQSRSRALKPNQAVMAGYFIKAVDKAIELSARSGRQIIIANFANTILGIVAPTARRLMCDISPCGAGRCFLTITPSGEMIPCGEFTGFKGFSGGNILSGAGASVSNGKNLIEKALRSEPFKKIRGRFAEKIEDCRVCVFRNICGAPCPAEMHSLGNMYKPSVFCEFYKEIIRYAFKLISQGKEKYCLRQSGLDELRYDYRFKR